MAVGAAIVVAAAGVPLRGQATNAAYDNAWPQWSPDGRRIVFASTRDGDWEIYVMAADGSQPRRLTVAPGRDAHPMFTARGARIVFQSPRDYGAGDEVDLYVMSADGTEPRRLVAAPGFDGVPVPSPDGRTIAFQRGGRRSAGDAFHWELFLVDSHGGNARQLTDNPWSSQVPSWSPDGRRLVFYADPPPGRDQLFVLDLATARRTPLAPSAAADNAPAWSPDGRAVAFVSTRDGTRDVYRVNVEGGDVVRLTRGLDVWSQPGWSPDGSRIVFSAVTAGVHEVYVMRADGTNLTRLTNGTRAPRSCSPRSSDWLTRLPDGVEKRAFVLDCTGCHQLSEQYARPGGVWRTEAQWAEAVTRMLGYAGATTGFPVISGDRDPARTAAWLAAHLRGDPPRGVCARPLPAGATITEFPMPEPGDLPHDVAVDAAGRVIVTGMFTHRMYVLAPDSTRFREVAIPVQGANPRAVDVDAAGNWWVVLGQPKRLARYMPDLQTWHTFDVGVYPHSLAIDGSGRVWFNGHFTRSPELIGFVDARSGEVTSIEVPSHPTLAAKPGGPIPYELRAAPDGRIWGSELLGNRIFAYDPATRAFAVHELPLPASGPRRFDVDAAGVVWIPAYGANALLRFDPVTRRFETFALPLRDAVPYVVRADRGTGLLWIGTSAGDVVFSFDSRTRAFTTYPLPSNGALVRHLAIDPRTHDVWLAYGASPGIPARIARLRVAAR